MEYQLYDEPLLGDWTIVTVINGRTTSQTFTVKQYGIITITDAELMQN